MRGAVASVLWSWAKRTARWAASRCSIAALVLNHIGTNPSRKKPRAIVANRATRLQGIASAETSGLKTLLLLEACCPTAPIVLPFCPVKRRSTTTAGARHLHLARYDNRSNRSLKYAVVNPYKHALQLGKNTYEI